MSLTTRYTTTLTTILTITLTITHHNIHHNTTKHSPQHNFRHNTHHNTHHQYNFKFSPLAEWRREGTPLRCSELRALRETCLHHLDHLIKFLHTFEPNAKMFIGQVNG
ncbi:hypothetical protein E2C01_082937 [Portunus trituberculatus]|uniref:Uncharacterized protein n=1 Tax=Portunus trituberculatus TaxID=210409 RepID=A0A5B7J365_PORTR|nr:hypothetical protein [Portunus trituberculatus]